MNIYNCYAKFDKDVEYRLNVGAKNRDEADTAFQKYVYEKRLLTKSCAQEWSIEPQ